MFNYYILLLKKTAHCLHGVQHLLDILRLLLRVQHQPPLVQQLHSVHQDLVVKPPHLDHWHWQPGCRVGQAPCHLLAYPADHTGMDGDCPVPPLVDLHPCRQGDVLLALQGRGWVVVEEGDGHVAMSKLSVTTRVEDWSYEPIAS